MTEREYFINPECLGDDVARWLISELRARGFTTDEEPTQEDFGWYFAFEAAGVRHDAVIGHRPMSNDGQVEWLCWIERKSPLLGSMLGLRKKAQLGAVEAIRQILTSSPVISSVTFRE